MMRQSQLLLFAGFFFSLTLASPGLARGLRWAASPIYYGYYGGPASSFHEAFHGGMALGFSPSIRGYPPSYFTPNVWNNYDPESDPDFHRVFGGKAPKRPKARVHRMSVAGRSRSSRRNREVAD